jgi:predicted DNA-binding protein YlxM (UPF0122 family)
MKITAFNRGYMSALYDLGYSIPYIAEKMKVSVSTVHGLIKKGFEYEEKQ